MSNTKPQVLTKGLTVRFTPEELALLRAAAQKRGYVQLASYLRALVTMDVEAQAAK